MLILKVKPFEEIKCLTGRNAAAICCEGCSELHYPENDIKTALRDLAISRTDIAVITLRYACSAGILRLYAEKHSEQINRADTVLVFACGVGVQTAVEILKDKQIVAACDTYPLPGYQGLTASKYDCELCGECHLNDTAGICPVTACSKSLINGQCGGAKNGMCEVEPDLECGWERINKRMSK